MRRTPRRTIAIALAAAALALSGCAAGSQSPTEGAGGAVSGDLTVYAAASLSGAFDEIGDAFEQENPDVRFTGVYDGSSTLATQSRIQLRTCGTVRSVRGLSPEFGCVSAISAAPCHRFAGILSDGDQSPWSGKALGDA